MGLGYERNYIYMYTARKKNCLLIIVTMQLYIQYGDVIECLVICDFRVAPCNMQTN